MKRITIIAALLMAIMCASAMAECEVVMQQQTTCEQVPQVTLARVDTICETVGAEPETSMVCTTIVVTRGYYRVDSSGDSASAVWVPPETVDTCYQVVTNQPSEVCTTIVVSPGYWMPDSTGDSGGVWVPAVTKDSCYTTGGSTVCNYVAVYETTYVTVCDTTVVPDTICGTVYQVEPQDWDVDSIQGGYTYSMQDSTLAIGLLAYQPVDGYMTVAPTTPEPIKGQTVVNAVEVDLSPSLEQNMQSAILTLSYAGLLAPGTDESTLAIYYLGANGPEKINGFVDTVNQTVTAMVTHFSTYAILAEEGSASVKSGTQAATFADGLLVRSAGTSAQVRFSLARDTDVSLGIYNASGSLIRSLVGNRLAAGFHSARWDGTDRSNRLAPCGTYFVVMKAGANQLVKSMILVR